MFWQDAEKAIKCLNNKQAMTKKLHVKWAHEPSNHLRNDAVNLNLKSDLVKNDATSSKPNERLYLSFQIVHKIILSNRLILKLLWFPIREHLFTYLV